MRKLMVVMLLVGLAGCGGDSAQRATESPKSKVMSGAERDAFISSCSTESLKTANVDQLEALNYCTCTLDGILAAFTIEEIEEMGGYTTGQKAIEMGITADCAGKHVDLTQ